MNSISCLVENGQPIALDSSVIVNLNATGFADRIVGALTSDVVIVSHVLRELERGEKNGYSDAADLRVLVADGSVLNLPLPSDANRTFLELVTGSAASTLGDGEAATIAYANASGAWAAIDERKARKICAARFSKLRILSTVDILGHPSVMESLTAKELSDAVFNALEVAHMQVQSHHFCWIAMQVGAERLSRCISLPRKIREG